MKIIIAENLVNTFEQRVDGTWIYFLLTSKSEKTARYNVVAKEGEIILGEIKWFGRWRKYALFPNENTVFESKCLNDIFNFLNYLMQKRKKT